MEDYGPEWKNVLGKPIPHSIYKIAMHVLCSNISKVSEVSVVLSKRGVSYRQFKCSSCDWTVELTRPKPCQSNDNWFLMSEPPDHNCNDTYKITRIWDLLNNQIYLNLLKTQTKLTYKDMMSLMEQKGLEVTLKKAAYSKAKARFRFNEKKMQSNQYEDLPRFLQKLSTMNPELSIAFQLDSSDRFFDFSLLSQSQNTMG